MNGDIVLSIDCSNRWTCVGVCAYGCPPAGIEADLGRGQAAGLPGLVESLLKREGLVLADVTCFAAAVGPGYFTGIRVGMAYACALACALGRKTVPLSSLEILLRSLPDWSAGLKAPLIAASRDRVFSAAWRDGVPLLPEKERTRGQLLAELGAASGKAALWGVDDPRLFAADGRGGVNFVRCPSGAAAASLAIERSRGAVRPDDMRARYLRDPGLGRP